MKRLITTSVILFFAFCAYAQDTNKTITLHEITVKAAKVVNRPDGMTIYPTDAQKQASNNGYSILEKLTLANLRIDNINHAISVVDNCDCDSSCYRCLRNYYNQKIHDNLNRNQASAFLHQWVGNMNPLPVKTIE